MRSESKLRSKGLLRAGVTLLGMTTLILSTFTLFLLGAADPSDITGTWKADVSKTTPPDNNELAVTLTIKEIGLRTYTIRLDSQTRDRGLVSEETTIACDGKARPLKRLDPAAAGGTIFCGRGSEISIRVKQEDGSLIEHAFRLTERNALNYIKTVYGHDRIYVFSRQ
jgi:hypothetical protein